MKCNNATLIYVRQGVSILRLTKLWSALLVMEIIMSVSRQITLTIIILIHSPVSVLKKRYVHITNYLNDDIMINIKLAKRRAKSKRNTYRCF